MKPTEQWHLSTWHVGRRVLWFDGLDSTNTFALAQAHDDANAGLVVLAGEQTAGRGQHGRSWSCPGGAGVLMSVLLFPVPDLRRAPILTAWAAVSVCEVIAATTGLGATIKWPNDVLVQGRKVCGILIEQSRGTVAGIGLNVNQPAEHFASLGLSQAASLAMFTGKTRDCREVARALIGKLDAELERLGQGDMRGLETRWKSHIGLVGEQVEIETVTAKLSGLLLNVSFDGLQLRQGNNKTLIVPPESVSHLKKTD